MSIQDKLSIAIPREVTGSDTYRRYQFQIACAMELIIKMASEEKDFIALMDYLDDIVLIENPNNEESLITFYQVKSKENGSFTINTVLKKEWIDKMYYNLNLFNGENVKSVFLSNAGIKFDSTHILNSFELVSLKDYLAAENLQSVDSTIIDSIAQSLKLPKEQIDHSNIYVAKTMLTLDDYDRQIKGELQSMASAICPSLSAVSLDTIFIKVREMLGARQACTFVLKEGESGYEVLCDKKGLSAKQFKEIIQVTKDVQLPDIKEINEFIKSLNIEVKENKIAFANHYRKFSEEIILHNASLINKIFAILDGYSNEIWGLDNEKLFDFCIDKLEITDIKSTLFYNENKQLIVILYLYKRSEN